MSQQKIACRDRKWEEASRDKDQLCCDIMKDHKVESMSGQNLLCCYTSSCNMEELVETEESTKRRRSDATRKFMSRLVTLTC